MKTITADEHLISYCGLYCGGCRRYLTEKCSGCRTNEKLSWCRIRDCNRKNSYNSCADCTLMPFESCKMNHNFISRFFSFIFGSDRDASIRMIKEEGPEEYVKEMARLKQMAVKRR